jgi:hypothetical protein
MLRAFRDKTPVGGVRGNERRPIDGVPAEEHNAENLLVIRAKALVEKYAANWSKHLE